MTARSTPHADNTAILARKAQGRRERASLSFAEKLDVLEALKKRSATMAEVRSKQKKSSR